MTSLTTLTDLTKRVLQRFFPMLFPPADAGGGNGDPATAVPPGNHLAHAFPELEQLQHLRGQRKRLRAMRDEELNKAEALVREIETLERNRYAQLTRARVEEDPAFTKAADQLLAEIERKERARKDAAGIAENLAQEADALVAEIEELERGALVYLGKFLEDRMADLAQEYARLAPETAELVCQIRAVQLVMQDFRTGNSNGFGGEVYIPAIVAGDGKTHAPLLDGGSSDFSRRARALADVLKAELQKLGHVYGNKYH